MSSTIPTLKQKYPLGKKPELTQKQLKPYRMVLQSITLPSSTSPKNTYYFNILTKESGSGLFSNERFFILSVQEKCLKYISKIPHGYLPFETLEEIKANPEKQKIMIGQSTKFICKQVPGKISTFSIQNEDKAKRVTSWVLSAGSSKNMNDWIRLLNSVRDGTYVEKYEKVEEENIEPEQNQVFQNPLYNNQQGNISPINNGNLSSQQQNSNAIINQNSNEPNKQENKISENRIEDQGLQSSNKHGPKMEQTSILKQKQMQEQQNRNSRISGPQSHNSGNRLQNSNISAVSNSNYLNTSNMNQSHQYLGYGNPEKHQQPLQESQVSHHKVEKVYEQSTNQQGPLGRQEISDENSRGATVQNPNFGKSEAPKPVQVKPKQQNTTLQDKKLDSNPQVAYNLTQSKLYPQENPNARVDYNPNPHEARPNHRTENSQQVTNQQPTTSAPNDFVEELKLRRQQNPSKFNTTNELSMKKMPIYEHQKIVEQQIVEQNQGSRFQTHQAVENFHKKQQPYDSGQAPHQYQKDRSMSPSLSQKFLNRENSGDKRQFQNDSNSPPKDSVKQYGGSVGRGEPNAKNQYARVQDLERQSQNHPYHVTSSASKGSLGRHRPFPQTQPNNHYDQNPYRPTTNLPDSTKNLSKIRSDYFMGAPNNNRQSRTHLQSGNKYPTTSKNQNIRHTYDQQAKEHEDESRHQHQYNNSREASLHNLNKVNSEFISATHKQNSLQVRSNSKYHVWNETWLETGNPNKKIEVHEQFIQRCQDLVSKIIEDLPLPMSYRQHHPYEIKKNYHIYLIDNIEITMHIFDNTESINGEEDNIQSDAPVLYDQTSYEELKRQFYNYNLILGVTSNQGFIKVPLCTYLEYRGVLALCRAEIPQSYREVDVYNYKDEFDALQQILKVRFLFGTYNIYESSNYRGADGRFVVLSNLRSLIPGIPNNLENENSYFRKQFLLQYDQVLQDLESSSEAHSFALKHSVPEFIQRLQSLEIHIVHTTDLSRQMHNSGLSLSYIPDLMEQTSSHYLKKIFKSEIVANIFTDIAKSELNHAFTIMPGQNLQQTMRIDQLASVVLDCAHALIEDMFTYSRRTENLWKMIVQEAMKRYRVMVSKEDTFPGYLLGAVMYKLGIKPDFKHPKFDKNKKFYVNDNCIPRECFDHFQIKTRRYDMESVCPTYFKVKEILDADPNQEQFEALVTILHLRAKKQLPDYFDPIREQLKAYMCNYIIFGEELQYESVDAYEYLYEEPLTANSLKSSLMAIKWLIKKRDVEKADQILEIKYYESSFWIGESNGPIIEFYDFFSMYYASIGNYKESINLAKSSLENVQKLLGNGALPAADKHYQLGNIFFKIGRKDISLNQYQLTKDILINNGQTSIPQFGIILLKISLISLSFGKMAETVTNALEAEKIFQSSTPNHEEQQIQCFQILARAYEITRKTTDIQNLSEVCGRMFNNTEKPKILKKMLKIIIYPRLTALSTQQQKSLTQILLRLQEQVHNSEIQAFNFLHKKAESQGLKKKIWQYLQNLVLLIDEINRRDLLRKHTSLSTRAVSEAEEMLTVFEAVGILVGFDFLVGCLKDCYYE